MQDATVIAGDQADPAFLERMLAEHGRDFDVIVDDGGHTMKQQITSFTVLWPAVRPGGVYFIEDLETSWSPMYGGRPGMTDDSADTAMGFTFRLIDEINGQVGHPRGELSASLRSVECMEGICAFYKKRAGEA